MSDAGIDAVYPGPDLNPGKPKYAIPGFQALLRVLRNPDDCWVKRITAA